MCAPAGRTGGAGPHCTLSAGTRTWVDWAKTGPAVKVRPWAMNANWTIRRVILINFLLSGIAYEPGRSQNVRESVPPQLRRSENPLLQTPAVLRARQHEAASKRRLALWCRLQVALLEIERRKPPHVASLERH